MLQATDGGSGPIIPPDLQITPAAAAAAAASTSANSYEKTIRMPMVRNKKYTFWFTYLYEDPDTKQRLESPRSPIVEYTFDIPNLTKSVQNLTMTAGIKSYSVKFDVDPTSVQEDMVFFESLTGAFAGEEYIVYVGTSTNVTINTSDFAPRWIKVRVRDKWADINHSDATAGPVTPANADPDTSTPPSAPTSASASGSIDTNDKSGFSGQATFSWTANTDTNTAGYVIRWTTNNPATNQNPVWEYDQVEGKASNSLTVTGLLPNTTYYYQVTAKSPYNAISWTSPYSGTFGPIVDSNAPSDVWAQLRSILSIGGKTADLFKIGTGISQSINTSITTTPAMVSGNYSGIILNKSTTNLGHNYWLNTGQFRVGSGTSFLYWDGSDIYTTGKINATGGSFTGDIKLNGGTLYAGTAANSGARVRLDNAGIFAYDSSNNQTVAITQADGKIDARQGYIGGWTINAGSQTSGTISKNGTILDSNGNITLGDATGTLDSIVRLSSTDATYRLWVGSQSPSTAYFKVDKTGKLYATGAAIDGTTTIGGTTASTVVSGAANGSTALTTAQSAATAAATAKTAADAAKAIADAALPSSNFNRDAIVNSINSTVTTTTINGGKITTGTISAQAVVTDFISAFTINADKINGGTITASVLNTGSGTSYIHTNTTLNGANCIAVGGIGFNNSNTGGWTTHCYPYWGGGSNYDLGTLTYRWNDTRLSGSLMVGHGGSDSVTSSSGPKTKLLPSGNIFANTLGTSTTAPASGTTLIQDSSGYLRVYVAASSRKYKENIEYQNTSQMYNIMSSLSPVTFNYKEDFSDRPDELHYGLIAEEVDEIQPGNPLVIYKDDEPDSVAYEKIPMFLVGAFKEMADKIKLLEEKLDVLQG
jgi:hypothetical protein